MEIHDVVEVEVDIVLVVETKIVQVEETRTAVSFFKFFDEIYHSLSKFAFSKIHALYTFFLICRFTARFDI